MKDIHHKIQSFIEESDFDALSPADQEMVLSVMSAASYAEQRNLIIASREMFDEEGEFLVPDPKTLHRLKEAHAAKHKSKGALALLFAIAEFRVPAYQVGMAAALLFLLYLGFGQRQEKSAPPITPQIAYQTVHDTVEVIKEELIEVPVTKYLTKVVYKEAPDLKVMASDVFSGGITPATAPPDLASIERSFGNSSVPESKLEQFRVVGL